MMKKYFITSDKKLIKKDLRFFFARGENFCCFKSKKALISYCQLQACDWIDIITGPKLFWHGVNEPSYNKILDAINDGTYVTYARIYNHLQREYYRWSKFETRIQEIGGTIV